jgi:Domain of unknown function (DUF4365)
LAKKSSASEGTGKRPPETVPSLKRRTRGHILASLSANSIERVFLGKGHTVLKSEQDYGIDLVVFTYDDGGYVEPGNIYIQLKATEAPRRSADGGYYSYPISVRDHNAWAAEPMPVFLVLYDAQADRAYWQYVQGYFEADPARRPKKGARSVAVRIPVANVFDAATVDYARGRKRAVLGQLSGAIRHVL